MRMLICIVVISFGWVACSDSNAIPKNVIERDKMEKILWDIIQADQYSTQYLKKDSSRINVKMETMKLYDQIFLIHHVTREKFKKSYEFYIEHPDVTKGIFDSLSARASKQRNEAYRRLSKPLPPAQFNPQAK